MFDKLRQIEERYRELNRSLSDPQGFWADAAEQVSWIKRWDTVLDDSKPPFYRWFKGGELNTCYNAVDRHVEQGRGDQAAIIYDSPVTGTVQTITYAELQDQVSRFAGALQAPLVKTAGLLQALPRNFAYGLKALIDEKSAA